MTAQRFWCAFIVAVAAAYAGAQEATYTAALVTPASEDWLPVREAQLLPLSPEHGRGVARGADDAMLLSEICRKVYLIHRRDSFRGEAMLVEALRGKANVEFVLDAKISALIGGDELSGVEVEQGGERRVLPVSGLFVSIGRALDTEVFSGLISLDKGGYAASGEDCLTVCPGVFVAGDCRAKSVRQLTTAMSDGSVAALAACAWLDK